MYGWSWHVLLTLVLLWRWMVANRVGGIGKDPCARMNRYRVYGQAKLRFMKACRVWYIIRPPGAVHWYKCNQCVKQMDHHCVWTSWCIGSGNYKLFFMFLATLNVTLISAIVYSIVIITAKNTQNDHLEVYERIYMYPQAILAWIIAPLFMIFSFPLLIFHIYLWCRGITTLEFLDQRRSNLDSDHIEIKPLRIKKVNASDNLRYPHNQSQSTRIRINKVVPVIYTHSNSVIKHIDSEKAEKVSFSNRVDEDLTAEYKGVDAPPSERLFDTFTGSREETKM